MLHARASEMAGNTPTYYVPASVIPYLKHLQEVSWQLEMCMSVCVCVCCVWLCVLGVCMCLSVCLCGCESAGDLPCASHPVLKGFFCPGQRRTIPSAKGDVLLNLAREDDWNRSRLCCSCAACCASRPRRFRFRPSAQRPLGELKHKTES